MSSPRLTELYRGTQGLVFDGMGGGWFRFGWKAKRGPDGAFVLFRRGHHQDGQGSPEGLMPGGKFEIPLRVSQNCQPRHLFHQKRPSGARWGDEAGRHHSQG